METTLLIKRKEAIILATIDAINEFGVQAVSTKEIAKKQGVSERIIFNHFPTKNDLFVAVLQHYSKYDDAIIQTAEIKQMEPLEAMIYFFDSYATYYENYPALTSITQSYEALNCNPQLSSIIQNIFCKKERFIKSQIEKAKRLDILNADVDSDDFANIMLGMFTRLCLKWRMKNYDFSLREKTLDTLNLVFELFNE